ncbi:tripartite tricarboxylate transporter TctB family protein [Rhizobium giardinii]|uniref:tripartite tricarboxylate transporter TctB family protein n=1 Tax=Rhizobium giardinii TaxID=56731 RepID=UPI0039DFF46F
MQEAVAPTAQTRRTQINAKDVITGILMIMIAGLGLYFNQDYEIGTASRMGPGYMPMLVFCLLALFGIGTLVIGLFNGPAQLERWAWRELGLILASLTVFAALLEHVGLATSVLLLVAISSFADKTQTVRGAAGLAAGLVALCWVVFVYLLNLGLPFLPPVLGFN